MTAGSVRAVERLVAALLTLSPGATGSVRVVRLDRRARHPSYLHGVVVLRAERDVVTGNIVFDNAKLRWTRDRHEKTAPGLRAAAFKAWLELSAGRTWSGP